MRSTRKLAIVLSLAGAPGCLAASTRAGADALLRDPGPPLAKVAFRSGDEHAEHMAASDGGDELARAARLEVILRIALANNPDIDEARERTRAAAARVSVAGRMPDLEAKAEVWGVPLARPWAVHESQMIMFGLRQSIPAPGSRDAQARAALEQARMSRDATEARALDVAQQVKRAFASYLRADAEYRVHEEHVGIFMRIADLARDRYRAGRGTQQEVLRTLVELSRLHTDVESIQQQRQSSRALLNTLMGRAPDAELGPAVAPPLPATAPASGGAIPRDLDARRPEIAAAERAIRKSEATLDAARASASRPAFMVGADYWLMPMLEEPHAWSAMVSMTLPWLSPQHRDEVRAAEHGVAADRRALASTKNVARYQVIEARTRVDAAAHTLAVLERDLLPRARDSFEAAQGSYAAGQGDALALLDAQRSYLDVRLDEARARARLEEAIADLERAVGGELPRARARARAGAGGGTP